MVVVPRPETDAERLVLCERLLRLCLGHLEDMERSAFSSQRGTAAAIMAYFRDEPIHLPADEARGMVPPVQPEPYKDPYDCPQCGASSICFFRERQRSFRWTCTECGWTARNIPGDGNLARLRLYDKRFNAYIAARGLLADPMIRPPTL